MGFRKLDDGSVGEYYGGPGNPVNGQAVCVRTEAEAAMERMTADTDTVEEGLDG